MNCPMTFGINISDRRE